jgi:hypothetical protein
MASGYQTGNRVRSAGLAAALPATTERPPLQQHGCQGCMEAAAIRLRLF